MASTEMAPLLELSNITDFYADGIHHIEVIGQNLRIVCFRWRLIDKVWQQVAVEFAMVRPIESILPARALEGLMVTRAPPGRGQTDLRLHS